MAIEYAIIQVRRGTAAQWYAANPLLSVGEIGLETDTLKYKIGDGSTYWNNLGYSPATIQFKKMSSATWVTINPILSAGEPGFETDTGKFKIGDGLSAWASLSYYASGGGGSGGESTSGIGPQLNLKSTGAASTGTGKDQILLGSDFAGGIPLLKVRVYSDVAPTGADLIIDLYRNGTSIWTATPANRAKVVAGAKYGTQTSFDTTLFYEGDVISLGISQIGSGTPGGNNLTIVMDFNWGAVVLAPPHAIRFLLQGNSAVGTKVAQCLMDQAKDYTNIIAYVDTAPTGASLIFYINKNGVLVATGTIIAGSNVITGLTWASGSGFSVAQGDRVSVDIHQVGSVIPGGNDLMITIS